MVLPHVLLLWVLSATGQYPTETSLVRHVTSRIAKQTGLDWEKLFLNSFRWPPVKAEAFMKTESLSPQKAVSPLKQNPICFC